MHRLRHQTEKTSEYQIIRVCSYYVMFLWCSYLYGTKRRSVSHLQIHYDRVGKDGLFSHKEVTVLYIPDLSDCLPSIDAWRDQWLAHKKAIAERERLHALKREVYYFLPDPYKNIK